MEFLGGVTGPFEQCAMIVSIVAHCSKALATLPRNSIPCAEKIYCRLFSGTPCTYTFCIIAFCTCAFCIFAFCIITFCIIAFCIITFCIIAFCTFAYLHIYILHIFILHMCVLHICILQLLSAFQTRDIQNWFDHLKKGFHIFSEEIKETKKEFVNKRTKNACTCSIKQLIVKCTNWNKRTNKIKRRLFFLAAMRFLQELK